MPISKDRFTTVPIVAVVKMYRGTESSDDNTFDENDINRDRHSRICLQNPLPKE